MSATTHHHHDTIEAAMRQPAKERPIPFITPMVRAIIEGRKTQTRRSILSPEGVAKIWHDGGQWILENAGGQCWGGPFLCPYGKPGDRLWVRETWAYAQYDSERLADEYIYRADYGRGPVDWNWRPSIHMPRVASRILLEITDVRAERLNDISEADAIAEGVRITGRNGYDNPIYQNYHWAERSAGGFSSAQRSFQSLWEKINGQESWDKNPWVWVIKFKQI